jgi:protein-disulfide isomerase
MKLALVLLAATLAFAAPVFAAPKPCDELKSEIEEKIKANGVKDFTLEVVPAASAKDGAAKETPKDGGATPAASKDSAGAGKVVGTCDGGTKKIVYKR